MAVTLFNPDGLPKPDVYRQVAIAEGSRIVFLAGQVPTDSQAKPVGNTVAEKATRMCQNTKTVLEAAGSSLEKVVKVTVNTALSYDFNRRS